MKTIFTKFLIFLLVALTYFLVFIILPNAYQEKIPHIVTSILLTMLALVFAIANVSFKKSTLSWLTLAFSITGSMLTGLLFGVPITLLAILSRREYSKLIKNTVHSTTKNPKTA